jgi:hypothetical protein
VKIKIIKFLKVVLPVFIGVYLTWYFISNAISAEKRSFYTAEISSELAAEEYYSSIILLRDNYEVDSLLQTEIFNFNSSSNFEEIKENFSDEIAKKIFGSNKKSLLKPLFHNQSYYIFYVNNIEPEITKEHFISSFSNVNYLWILLSLIVAFLSHLSRAFRWKYLLEPLGLTPKLNVMYHSVMIGYIINLTVPRSGELARAAYFSKYQNSSTEKVFGTIVVERVVDLLMFGLIFVIALFLQSDQDTFNQLRQTESTGLPNWLLPSIIILFVLTFGLVVFLPRLRNKLIQFLKGILEGCMTILKLKQKLAFIFHTFLIWFAYILMLWLTALAIPEMAFAQISAIFACFVAGTFAIGATPGGIGLYPIMISSVLISLYGYTSEVANSFGLLMWTTQTALMVVLGIYSLIAIKKVA